jgi:hypothetical protein
MTLTNVNAIARRCFDATSQARKKKKKKKIAIFFFFFSFVHLRGDRTRMRRSKSERDLNQTINALIVTVAECFGGAMTTQQKKKSFFLLPYRTRHRA